MRQLWEAACEREHGIKVDDLYSKFFGDNSRDVDDSGDDDDEDDEY